MKKRERIAVRESVVRYYARRLPKIAAAALAIGLVVATWNATTLAPSLSRTPRVRSAGHVITKLRDDFDRAAMNTSWWSIGTLGARENPNVSVRQVYRELQISPAPDATGYSGYLSNQSYTLVGGSARVQVIYPAGPGSGTTFLHVGPSGSQYLFIEADTTNIVFGYFNGSRTVLATQAYSNVSDGWWGIRESGGAIVWETSVDGVTWRQQATTATPFPVTNVRVNLAAGAAAAVPSPGPAIFDDFNVAQALKYTRVSVTRFGARRNGTTDDTAAVQKAMNSGKPSIYFPAGTYSVRTVSIPGTVREISGASNAVIAQRVQNDNVFTSRGLHDIVIHDLRFRGIGGTGLIDSNSGLAFVGSGATPNVTVRDVTFTNFLYNGIMMSGYNGVKVDHVQCNFCSQGIMIGSGTSNVIVERSTLNGSQAGTTFNVGMQFSTVAAPSGRQHNSWMQMIGNVVENRDANEAFMVHDAAHLQMIGNSAVNVDTGFTIAAPSESTTAMYVTHVLMDRNTYTGPSRGRTSYHNNGGLVIGGTAAVALASSAVQNNMFKHSGYVDGGGSGLYIYGDTTNLTLADNLVTDVVGSAIVVSSNGNDKDMHMKRNVMSNATSVGLYFLNGTAPQSVVVTGGRISYSAYGIDSNTTETSGVLLGNPTIGPDVKTAITPGLGAFAAGSAVTVR